MKTFNEYLKIKESDFGSNTNKPMPGQAYEYYLNRFNSSTKGNLQPQHIEALKKHKESDAAWQRSRMARNNEGNPQSYGKESDFGSNTNTPMPGQAYEYYLNRFNSSTKGNLQPQHIEALKKHKESDKIYNQKLSAYRMAKNNEGNPQSYG